VPIWVTCLALMYRLSGRSGVTDAELIGSMPGDELLPDVAVEWTRGTVVDAPPERIWPWLVQMGFGRGGWYTSRLFDRLVWRIDNPSSDVLRPEYQHVEVGDLIPDGPNYEAYFRVAEVNPEKSIVYRSIRHPYRGHPVDPSDLSEVGDLESQLVDDGVFLDFTWSWELRALPGDQTRLLVRTRANYSPKWLVLTEVPLGLVDFYHVTTMFRGVARRVKATT